MEPLSRVTAATLDVLSALLDSGTSTWGLAVIKASGRPAGSVYPILDRLEKSGWVSSDWGDEPDRPGPRRRYYEFTTDGALAARGLVNARARAAVGRVATA